MNPSQKIEALSGTTLVALDVDGVMTDGSILIDNRGGEYKSFHALDGHGIKQLIQNGIQVAAISGRNATAVAIRMEALGVRHVIQDCSDKGQALRGLQDHLGISPDHTVCMGDDLPDLPMFALSFFSATVPNAHPDILAAADWVSARSGGQGAVRELCDLILRPRSHTWRLPD